MQTIHTLIERKLQAREAEREKQRRREEQRIEVLKERFQNIAAILQCDEYRITSLASNTGYAELIYYYDGFKKKFHCYASYDEETNNAKIYIVLNGQPIKVTSDPDNIDFLLDQIANAFAKKIEHYRQY